LLVSPALFFSGASLSLLEFIATMAKFAN